MHWTVTHFFHMHFVVVVRLKFLLRCHEVLDFMGMCVRALYTRGTTSNQYVSALFGIHDNLFFYKISF